MESYLSKGLSDLITPDGKIIELKSIDDGTLEARVLIENISSRFVGFYIDPSLVFFNIKSSLAQLGVNGIGIAYHLDLAHHSAEIQILISAYGPVATSMLQYIEVGAYIGKLFAADDRRRIRDPDYLFRMFGRCDHRGSPLLSLGGMQGSDDLVVEKLDNRTIAFLTLKEGIVEYNPSIYGFLPTIGKALTMQKSIRDLLYLHQTWIPNEPKIPKKDGILLVKTLPLHIRTVFGHVVNELLPQNYKHTTASILQPDTTDSGDIYELYGASEQEIHDIPVEFYMLEPHREHIFFSDRDQLQICLEDDQAVFDAFATMPQVLNSHSAVFVVKGEQMMNLKEEDWILRKPRKHDFPGVIHSTRQGILVDRNIQNQAEYPFLKSIADEDITSQGALFTRCFPSPLMKRMLLSDEVQRCLKRLYFQHPSSSRGEFFSHEDRFLLIDLAKFGIPVYWVDPRMGKVLQYVQRPGKDCGMFVPLGKQEIFKKCTFFGIYGSNLFEGMFEEELYKLLSGIIEMKKEMKHPLLNPNSPLAMVTGGGPGAMEVGNRVAKKLHVLSCANIVDFRTKDQAIVNEQLQNPHVEAKTTYCLDKLIERQAEFYLDFPIFLTGGIGTDFEFTLEEVKRKVGSMGAYPILLFGSVDYWTQKISYRFRCNFEHGTIKGSEWISNCFYCVQTAEQALNVYRNFFRGQLPIGKGGPIFEKGFVEVPPITK